MAQLPQAFNPNAPGQDGVGNFSAINPGDYVAQIIKSEMKQTKNGAGQYLAITWQILEGEFVGRMLWTRLNLVNPSSEAVEIANKHLTSICRAVNINGAISESSVLHGIPCIIRVVKTAATSQYPESNEVKNYMPIGSNAGMMDAAMVIPQPQTTSAPAMAPVPQVAQAPTTKPPWLK